MKTPAVKLNVPLSAATLEDIARDFERRAAVVAGAHAIGLPPTDDPELPARLVESRVWEEAAKVLRAIAAERK